jgi:D-alanyl-D-alanine dipeptidase
MLPLLALAAVALVGVPELPISGRPPADFVALEAIAPDIVQDIRYAGPHNFTGAPVPGYGRARCLLTAPTARALASAQAELMAFGLGLKVYDCFRPHRAVLHFAAWAEQPAEQRAKAEFYPSVDKARVHRLGYIAHQSGHSRGSTVDVTLVPYPAPPEPAYRPGQRLVSCAAPRELRFADNSLEMGTGYDCFDARANTQSPNIPPAARAHRLLLRAVLHRWGLINYPKEWWHFTLAGEPHRHEAFDFDLGDARIDGSPGPDRPEQRR